MVKYIGEKAKATRPEIEPILIGNNIYKDDVFDQIHPQVSVKKKLFRKLRKFSAKNIENMISLSRSLFLSQR